MAPIPLLPAMAISTKRSMHCGTMSGFLESVCDQWELTGFHRATYEYHAEKAS